MWIDEGKKRIVTFVVITVDPLLRVPMPVWYEIKSATAIRTRLRLDQPWQTYAFRLQGDQFFWRWSTNPEYGARRLPVESRPEWFDARLAAVYAKMDAAEKLN